MSVARSSVPPVVAPAPTVEWISSMNRMGSVRSVEGGNHRLEPLLEVAAESCAGQQRRRVEGEHLGALEDGRDVVVDEALRQAFGERGLADARVTDEHRVVLSPPAQDLHRPLQFDRAADQRVELALARAFREVERVGGQRIGLRAAVVAVAALLVRLARARRRAASAAAAPC